jgi:hypothetical protein
MQAVDIVVGVVAFGLVAGYAALSWLRRGRDPEYTDDASVLLPAPPPGMTAATATIVLGEDGRTAFMAALLDLASRDEIAFVVEARDGGADQIGIAIHGGDSTDPRVRLNRRNPIGEGESWLLGELKAFNLIGEQGHIGHDEAPSAELMQTGLQMMAAMMRSGMATAEDDDSFATRAAHEHGLFNQPMPDVSGFAAAYEAKHGRPLAPKTLANISMMSSIAAALQDPAPIVADPDGFLDRLQAQTGRPLTDDERAKAKKFISQVAGRPSTSAPVGAAASPTTPASGADPNYVPATRARSIPVAFLLGPLLQRYALRHGWVRGMPFFARIKWRAIGVVEAVVGLLIAGISSSASATAVAALGVGVAAGGVATYLIAPAMPSVSVEGSVMRAQLAAYQRTLQASLGQASSLADVATASRLTWLETPDQTVVWAVALGLKSDVEAFLGRQPQQATESFALAPSSAVDNPAAIFGGIELIGTARPEIHST